MVDNGHQTTGATSGCVRRGRVSLRPGTLLAVLLLTAVAGAGFGAATDSTTAQPAQNVTVVTNGNDDTDFGNQTVDLIERGVDLDEQSLSLSVVASTAVDDSLVQQTDAFVFRYLDSNGNEVVPVVENDSDTHAVYVEQYDLSTTNAIFKRAGVVNDPDSVQRALDSGEANNVSFEIQTAHPLFEGVGGAGDSVLVHASTDSDRVFFDTAEGETLATVGVEGEPADGAVAAVDPESESVLLGTIAPHAAQEASEFTDDAARILGNAVLFGLDTEPPEVELSGLDIAGQGSEAVVLDSNGSVSANVSHVGGGAGEVNVTLAVGDTTVTRSVEIAGNQTVTLTFEEVVGLVSPGQYPVTVSAGNTSVTGSLLVSVDVGGDGSPATDTTGDGLLNDVDGSGEFSIFDVQAFFTEFESPVVETNANLFDFEPGDGVNIFDVQALFNQLAAAE